MSKKLYIIIATYNGEAYISDCLNSIYKNPGQPRVIVVDNASSDQTKQVIRSHFPMVELIENNRNRGFARANNTGIRQALRHGADYLLLLNQDTEVAPGLLPKMVRFMEKNPKIGLASPLVLYPGEQRLIWFAGSELYRGARILTAPTLRVGRHIHKKQPFGRADQANPIDWVSGCALCIRRSLVERIGLFDQGFFMYGEDVDYSLRARAAGYRLGLNPSSWVIHKEPLATRYRPSFKLLKKCYHRFCSRIRLARRHFTFRERCYLLVKFLFWPLIFPFYAFRR